MSKNPFAPDYDDLPETLAIFPLEGVLLLPNGHLPLNVFEPRYLAMVDDAMAGSRMIGIVQPDLPARANGDEIAVYKTGCAGKITEFSETEDGRYEIKLNGISRFKIKEEHPEDAAGFRRVRPDWTDFANDLKKVDCLNINRDKLVALLKPYFESEGMECDWDAVQTAPDGKLMTCLAMASPFSPAEKQALLEAPCCKTRAEDFLKLLEVAVCDRQNCGRQH